jgi:hypothetical protein
LGCGAAVGPGRARWRYDRDCGSARLAVRCEDRGSEDRGSVWHQGRNDSRPRCTQRRSRRTRARTGGVTKLTAPVTPPLREAENDATVTSHTLGSTTAARDDWPGSRRVSSARHVGGSRPKRHSCDPAILTPDQAQTVAIAQALATLQAPPAPASGTTTGPSSAAVTPAASGPANNDWYAIYAGDDTYVINAKGCTVPTILITYPVSTSCDGGLNEAFSPALLTNGYDALVVEYNGGTYCAHQGGLSGSLISVANCPSNFNDEEWWYRQPQNTPAPCASGWHYIVPAYDYSLDFNVAGGNGARRNIILYSHNGCPPNGIWYFKFLTSG